MTPLQILKKVRRGLTPKKNFDPWRSGRDRPHCVIGEFFLVNEYFDSELLKRIVTLEELKWLIDGSKLTHSRALAILDAAIRRQAKKEKR